MSQVYTAKTNCESDSCFYLTYGPPNDLATPHPVACVAHSLIPSVYPSSGTN